MKLSQKDMELPVSMTLLAEQLNVSCASLYRTQNSLVSRGVIEKQGKKLKILNLMP